MLPRVFDDAELVKDPRQPAPYPRFDHLMDFAESFKRSDDAKRKGADASVAKRVNLKFETMPDRVERVLENVVWESVKEAWAVTRITQSGTITCLIQYSAPPADLIQNVAVHELVHVYRAKGLFEHAEWFRLVECARDLGVMQLPIRDFVRPAGYLVDEGRKATLGDFYAQEYGGRELFEELMTQEAIAHLFELSRRGDCAAGDLAPVQDILDKFFRGEVANRPSLGDFSLMGVLSSVEPT